MRRFDAMEKRRAGLLSIDSDAAKSPSGMGVAAVMSLRSARWLMTVSGVEPHGPMGALEVAALLRVLRAARGAWREDMHGDLSRTMSALDRGLRDLESRFSRFKPKSADKPNPDAPQGEAPRPA